MTVYWDYIRVEELLSLQNGLEDSDKNLSNDEVMFIAIHQIDEIWFKLAVRELLSLRNLLAGDHVPEQTIAAAVRGIRRSCVIFDKLTSHFELMETLTTRDYLAFRDKLSPASGFQSAGLREAEILMGLEDTDRIPLGMEHNYMQALMNPDGTDSSASLRVKARLQDPPSIKQALNRWLYRTPIQGSTPEQAGDRETVMEFIDAFLQAYATESWTFTQRMHSQVPTPEDALRLTQRHERGVESARHYLYAEDAGGVYEVVRSRAAILFIESYRELPLLAFPRELIDGLVALEQAMVIFRQRHARMVERVIGKRTGTGGSAGVDYLDQTALKYRMFKDVWAVRTLLVKEDALPPVKNPEIYQVVR